MFKSFVTGGVGSIVALSQTGDASRGGVVMLLICLIGLAILVVGKFMSYQSRHTVRLRS